MPRKDRAITKAKASQARGLSKRIGLENETKKGGERGGFEEEEIDDYLPSSWTTTKRAESVHTTSTEVTSETLAVKHTPFSSAPSQIVSTTRTTSITLVKNGIHSSAKEDNASLTSSAPPPSCDNTLKATSSLNELSISDTCSVSAIQSRASRAEDESASIKKTQYILIPVPVTDTNNEHTKEITSLKQEVNFLKSAVDRSLQSYVDAIKKHKEAIKQKEEQNQLFLKEKDDKVLRLEAEVAEWKAASEKERKRFITQLGKTSQQASLLKKAEGEKENLKKVMQEKNDQIADLKQHQETTRIATEKEKARQARIILTEQKRAATAESAAAESKTQSRIKQGQIKSLGNQLDRAEERILCLETDLQSADDELEEIERKYDKLLSNTRYLRSKIASTQKAMQDAKDEAEKENARGRKHLQLYKSQLATSNKLTNKNHEMTMRINELEKDQKSKDVLIKAAVDIRLRHLETSRGKVDGISRENLKRDILEAGNVAAHRGHIELDAAMFKLDLIPETYLDTGRRVFRSLYDEFPEDYPSCAPGIYRIQNCEASVYSVRGRYYAGQTATCEDKWLDMKAELVDDESQAWDWDLNPEIEEKLALIESHTEILINFHRKRSNREQQEYFWNDYD